MVNRLATAATRLATRIQGRASETVVYNRGGSSVTGVSAVIGKSDHETRDDYGIPQLTESRDFIFAVADLSAVLTTPDVPKIDDTIEWDGREYTVMPFGPDGYCWRWCEHGRILIRVHTKETGTV